MEGSRSARATETGQTEETVDEYGPSNTEHTNEHNSETQFLDILYTNADCLTNKIQELNELINSQGIKPNIIAITEVNPKNMSTGITPQEFNIEGYNSYHVNIGLKGRRGIIVYVECNLKSTSVEIEVNFEEMLVMTINCTRKNKLILVICYRSPNSETENNNVLITSMQRICDIYEDMPLLFIGDFNLPNIKWENYTLKVPYSDKLFEVKFLNCLKDNFLEQHVSDNTRKRGQNKENILDLVITNQNIVDDITILSPLGKSDHCVLSIKCGIAVDVSKKCNRFNYNKGDYKSLQQFLNRDWHQELSNLQDINDMWLTFKNILLQGVMKYVPMQKSWKQKQSWKYPINKELQKLIRQKHSLWKKYIKTKDVNIARDYRTVRNKVKKYCNGVKVKRERDIATRCKENPKVFWQHVNSLRKCKNVIGDLKVTKDSVEEIVTEDKDKAEALAAYFAQVYTRNDEDKYEVLTQIKSINNMEELIISENNIKIKLSQLKINKSPGPDSIHPRVLKETRNEITPALCIIFVASLRQGTLPRDWKKSTITAIHKKGSKSQISNYRPISLTSVCCKVLESIIRDNIMSYFNVHKLFSPNQFGFIPGRSAMIQLLTVMDKWTEGLEEPGQIDVIYTDFEKHSIRFVIANLYLN